MMMQVQKLQEEHEVPKLESRARKILHGLGFDRHKQDALTHTFSGESRQAGGQGAGGAADWHATNGRPGHMLLTGWLAD